MSEYKYIVFEDSHGNKHPVVFPGNFIHADMATAVMAASTTGPLRPVSAGMCQIVATWAGGKSETMQMVSDDKDRTLLNTHNYTGGAETGMEAQIEKLMTIRSAELLIAMNERG